MGCSSKASAVIGVRISTKTVLACGLAKTPIRGCAHPETPGKFCPECGAAIWKVISSRTFEDIDDFEQNTDLAGFSCAYDTDQEHVHLGISAQTEWEGGRSAPELLPDAAGLAARKAALEAFLEPLGLWNERSYGLWPILYVSY